ncbi:MAG TPA: RDD family protein [Candidatus Nanoarchaeia archaeon]|nr:RDD family protein [Candidatus Nanoarchaeia archaeon]
MDDLNLPNGKYFIANALIWKRIVAFLIDMMIINLVVLFPFKAIFSGMVPKGQSFSETLELLSKSTQFTNHLAIVAFIIALFVIMYFYRMEKKMSQTIGKKVLGIYVVSDTGELKMWQAIVRSLVFLPAFPFILLWLIDPLFMFFNKSNQRLSEVLSKTRVVERFNYE